MNRNGIEINQGDFIKYKYSGPNGYQTYIAKVIESSYLGIKVRDYVCTGLKNSLVSNHYPLSVTDIVIECRQGISAEDAFPEEFI